MPGDPASHARVPFRSGDLWVATLSKGRGRAVEIVHVSERHVYFMNYGKGGDGSRRYKLLHPAFRINYAPLRLARTARPNNTPILAPSPPIHPTRTEEHAVAIFSTASFNELPPIVVGSYEELRPSHSHPTGRRGPYKVTAEQIRDIWQLYQAGLSPTEIGATYDLSPPTVINIGRGKEYRWATADLRGEGPPIVLRPAPTPEPAAAASPPAPPAEEETPVTVETTETIAPPPNTTIAPPEATAPATAEEAQAWAVPPHALPPTPAPQPCETTEGLALHDLRCTE